LEWSMQEMKFAFAVDSSSSIALNQDATDAGFVTLKQFPNGLVCKKGSTNMSQAHVVDCNTPSSVSLIVNLHSNKYLTDGMSQQLTDKAIMKYFGAVDENGINSDTRNHVERWARLPCLPFKAYAMHIKGGLNEDVLRKNYADQKKGSTNISQTHVAECNTPSSVSRMGHLHSNTRKMICTSR